MTFQTSEKTIGEYTFEVSSLGFKDGRAVQEKAAKMLFIVASDEGKLGFSPLLVASFADEMKDVDFEFVINKLAEKSRVKQPGGQYLPLNAQKEIVFAANNLDMMYEWLHFALEVNFPSFLDKLKKVQNIAGPLVKV